MNYREWHIGMKVVFVGVEGFCVTGQVSFSPGSVHEVAGLEFCEKGSRVRGVDDAIYVIGDDGLYIQIDEDPTWYHAAAFRPIQPRKTDISIFTAMLANTRHEVPA